MSKTVTGSAVTLSPQEIHQTIQQLKRLPDNLLERTIRILQNERKKRSKEKLKNLWNGRRNP